MCVSGRCSASLRTTSAAFTTALSAPNGVDPWLGVPVTTMSTTAPPFSPVTTSTFVPCAPSLTMPPTSVST